MSCHIRSCDVMCDSLLRCVGRGVVSFVARAKLCCAVLCFALLCFAFLRCFAVLCGAVLHYRAALAVVVCCFLHSSVVTCAALLLALCCQVVVALVLFCKFYSCFSFSLLELILWFSVCVCFVPNFPWRFRLCFVWRRHPIIAFI